MSGLFGVSGLFVPVRGTSGVHRLGVEHAGGFIGKGPAASHAGREHKEDQRADQVEPLRANRNTQTRASTKGPGTPPRARAAPGKPQGSGPAAGLPGEGQVDGSVDALSARERPLLELASNRNRSRQEATHAMAQPQGKVGAAASVR